MKDLYKERTDLIIELRLNNDFIRAWLDEGMPETWTLNVLRSSEKIKVLTVDIASINELLKELKKEV